VTRLRLGKSIWLDRYRGRLPAFPALTGKHETDVAIVGGGVTGCACAYVLADLGLRVVLLDARHIGRGSTSASTALLMQEADVDFADLSDRYGSAVARRVWHTSRRAVGALVGTLRSLNVQAALHTLPSVYFTRDPDRARSLRHELTLRHEAGLRGRWLSEASLKARTGIDGAGAILTPGNAQVDPFRACLALARAARRRGASLHGHSRVQRIRTTPAGVQLDLSRGQIRASHVIIATGYATPEFKPLVGHFRMFNTYVIATPRLSRAKRSTMGLGDVMVWDTERPYHYARWTDDGRLLIGGRDRPVRPGRQRVNALRQQTRALSADLAALYPVLEDERPEYAWEGLFATTPDGLPYIGSHRRYPRHLFALGYGGNGMTFGFLAAQILARALSGRPHQDDALFAFSRTGSRQSLIGSR
jgi:glycine/D-amino acid oxidase-like deaminating enzyme